MAKTFDYTVKFQGDISQVKQVLEKQLKAEIHELENNAIQFKFEYKNNIKDLQKELDYIASQLDTNIGIQFRYEVNKKLKQQLTEQLGLEKINGKADQIRQLTEAIAEIDDVMSHLVSQGADVSYLENFGKSVGEMESRITDLENKVKSLNELLESSHSDLEYQNLTVSLENAQDQVEELRNEVSRLNAELEEAQNENYYTGFGNGQYGYSWYDEYKEAEQTIQRLNEEIQLLKQNTQGGSFKEGYAFGIDQSALNRIAEALEKINAAIGEVSEDKNLISFLDEVNNSLSDIYANLSEINIAGSNIVMNVDMGDNRNSKIERFLRENLLRYEKEYMKIFSPNSPKFDNELIKQQYLQIKNIIGDVGSNGDKKEFKFTAKNEKTGNYELIKDFSKLDNEVVLLAKHLYSLDQNSRLKNITPEEFLNQFLETHVSRLNPNDIFSALLTDKNFAAYGNSVEDLKSQFGFAEIQALEKPEERITAIIKFLKLIDDAVKSRSNVIENDPFWQEIARSNKKVAQRYKNIAKFNKALAAVENEENEKIKNQVLGIDDEAETDAENILEDVEKIDETIEENISDIEKIVIQLTEIKGILENITSENYLSNMIETAIEKFKEFIDLIQNNSDFQNLSTAIPITKPNGEKEIWYHGVNKNTHIGWETNADDKQTYWTTNKKQALAYAGPGGKIYQSEIAAKKATKEIDLNGQSSVDFLYLGDQTDEASKKITDAYKDRLKVLEEIKIVQGKIAQNQQLLNQSQTDPEKILYEGLIRQSEEELSELNKELLKYEEIIESISQDESNPYNTHAGTHEVVDYWFKQGFGNVLLKNVLSTVDTERNGVKGSINFLSNELVTHDASQLINTKVEDTIPKIEYLNNEYSETVSLFQELIKYMSSSELSAKDFFNMLSQGSDSLDETLLNTLSALSLLKDEKFSGEVITKGMTNKGGILTDDYVVIAREASKYREETEQLIPLLDEAADKGANVARVVGLIHDEQNDLIYEIQQRMPGSAIDVVNESLNDEVGLLQNSGEDLWSVLKNLNQTDVDIIDEQETKKDIDFLKATDEQILKLINDVAILNGAGLYIDTDGSNLMYDKENGFSFIDLKNHLVLGQEELEGYSQNTPEETISSLLNNYFYYALEDVEDSEKLLNKFKRRVKKLQKKAQENHITEESSILNDTTQNTNFELKEEQNNLEEVSESAQKAADNKILVSQAEKKLEDSTEQTNSELKEEADSLKNLNADKAVDEIKDLSNVTEKLTDDTKKNTEAQKEQENEINKNSTAQNKLAFKEYESLTKRLSTYFKLAQYSLTKEFDEDPAAQTLFKNLSEDIDQALNKVGKFAINIDGTKESFKNATQAAEEFQQSFANAFKSYKTNFIGDVEKQIESIEVNKRGFEYIPQYYEELNQLKNTLEELKNYKLDIVTGDEINDVSLLENTITKMLAQVRANTKNVNFIQVDRSKIAAELTKITSYIEKNTKLPGGVKEQLRDLQRELELALHPDVATTARDFEILKQKIQEVEYQAEKTGKKGRSFLDQVKQRLTDMNAKMLAQYFSIHDWIRYIRQMGQTVVELDSAITELRKVSNATDERLALSFDKSAQTAKELGDSITNVINVTADWSRLGYDVDAAEELARVTTLFKNVGDNMSAEDASSYLISTLQGFQKDASEAERIIDTYNEVANNFAIDTRGIGEALQRSAASFNAANTDLSGAVAVITAANSVVQNPEQIGTAMKTLSARIRGSKAELEELGEEEENVVELTSKLRNEVKAMTGFDIMEDEDTYKSIDEIIIGIGEHWQELTDIQQAALAEDLAGKRNSNVLIALLQNAELVKKVYETAEGAAGSATKEQENYAKSIQYSLDRFKATWQEIQTNLLQSDNVKSLVESAATALDGLGKSAELLAEPLSFVMKLLGGLFELLGKLSEMTNGWGTAGLLGAVVVGLKRKSKNNDLRSILSDDLLKETNSGRNKKPFLTIAGCYSSLSWDTSLNIA